MSESARKFVINVVLFLLAGAAVGWLYGQTLWGLLAFALLALGWQVWQLLSFDRALRTGNFDNFRVGESLWAQLFSRFRFEHERAVRRKASYRRLLREVRKSTDAMPDGALILDANNEIVSCNRAVGELAGLKRKKDKGQRIDNILRDPKLVSLVNGDDFERSVEIPSPVQDGHWLNCRVVPYGADQKLLIIRDVTDRIRLAKMRRDFVANASHELRSPLTVISGYVDTLADDEDIPSQWVKPVQQMRVQSQRMNQILRELMELSRLESSGVASRDAAIDVAQILADAKNTFESQADGASIVVEAEPKLKLLGNPAEIESVVVNLLSNALRHTPPDGRIRLLWQADDRAASLTVEDTGDGIEPEHIPHLTERFFRVDRGRSRDAGGVGLGLAIVKHALMRHDAVLEISSEPGKGSQFRCVFPANRVTRTRASDMS
ncbi:MAG: phosphate regulon sensor histidine kinase PhoR [Gammaproteobacteria bacterium]|nr:phosphate regulon sensor histidine kinase PhoR [Gammaproteobacteria bacterium]